MRLPHSDKILIFMIIRMYESGTSSEMVPFCTLYKTAVSVLLVPRTSQPFRQVLFTLLVFFALFFVSIDIYSAFHVERSFLPKVLRSNKQELCADTMFFKISVNNRADEFWVVPGANAVVLNRELNIDIAPPELSSISDAQRLQVVVGRKEAKRVI